MKRLNLIHIVLLAVASAVTASAMAIEPVHAQRDANNDVIVVAGDGQSAVHLNNSGQVKRLVSQSGRVIELMYAKTTDNMPIAAMAQNYVANDQSRLMGSDDEVGFSDAIAEMIRIQRANGALPIASPSATSAHEGLALAKVTPRQECAALCTTAARAGRITCRIVSYADPLAGAVCNDIITIEKEICFDGCRAQFP
jgi:hypothetical protein